MRFACMLRFALRFASATITGGSSELGKVAFTLKILALLPRWSLSRS